MTPSGGDADGGRLPRPTRPGRIRLGRGREFDAIRRWVDAGGPLPDEVKVGPGDDGAVLEGGWAVSSDLSVEDVHFRRSWLSDREVGYRAAAVALSDLAAMGAEAVGVLVSVAASADVDLDAVQDGLHEAARSVGAAVIGGDLSASPGPLFLDVTVLGRTAWPALRSGACPGDEIWVTGSLGAPAAAVAAWEAGAVPAAALRDAFARPPVRIEAACRLLEEGYVHALLDLSDGVAGDLGHLAAASDVRTVVEPRRLPVHPAVSAEHAAARAEGFALRGGEDYELCFTSPPGAFSAEEAEGVAGVSLTRVGRVEEGSGVWIDRGDGLERDDAGGWDHLDRGEEAR